MTDGPERPRGLREILGVVARRMQADFDASGLVEHRGAKGTVRERDLREFLDKYVPRNLAVLGSSEVVDVTGAVSGQCDVLLVDPQTPPLWAAEDLRVVPAECVHIVLEVKSNLTAEELRSAWRSVRRVKALTKTAYLPESGPIKTTVNAFGREWDYTPTAAHVFAFDGATLETLGEVFAELANSEPNPAMRLDSVFVLNRGVLAWIDPESDTIRPTGRPGDYLQGIAAAPEEVLMQFVAFLALEAGTIIQRRFDPRKYMFGNIGHGVGTWRVE